MPDQLLATARVAGFLLDLARRYGVTAPIDLQISRRDIADVLDLSVEMACRALTRFAEARLIAIPNVGQIEIIDVIALKAIADTDTDQP